MAHRDNFFGSGGRAFGRTSGRTSGRRACRRRRKKKRGGSGGRQPPGQYPSRGGSGGAKPPQPKFGGSGGQRPPAKIFPKNRKIEAVFDLKIPRKKYCFNDTLLIALRALSISPFSARTGNQKSVFETFRPFWTVLNRFQTAFGLIIVCGLFSKYPN